MEADKENLFVDKSYGSVVEKGDVHAPPPSFVACASDWGSASTATTQQLNLSSPSSLIYTPPPATPITPTSAGLLPSYAQGTNSSKMKTKTTGIRAPSNSASNLLLLTSAQHHQPPPPPLPPSHHHASSSSSSSQISQPPPRSQISGLGLGRARTSIHQTPTKRTNSPHQQRLHHRIKSSNAPSSSPSTTALGLGATPPGSPNGNNSSQRKSASYNTALINALNIDTASSKVKSYYEECFDHLDQMIDGLPEKVRISKLPRETISNFQAYTTGLRDCLTELRQKKPIFYNFCLAMESKLTREIDQLRNAEQASRTLAQDLDSNKTKLQTVTSQLKEAQLEKQGTEQEYRRLLGHLGEEKESLMERLNERETAYADLLKEFQAIQAQRLAQEVELTRLEGQYGQVQQSQGGLVNEVVQLKTDLQARADALSEVRSELESARAELLNLTNKQAFQAQALEVEERKRKKLAEKNIKYQEELEANRQAQVGREAEINDFFRTFAESQQRQEDRIAKLELEKAQLEAERAGLQQRQIELVAEVNDLRRSNLEAISKLEKLCLEKDNQIDRVHGSAAHVQVELERAQHDLERVKENWERAELYAKTLTEKIEAANSQQQEMAKQFAAEKEALNLDLIKMESANLVAQQSVAHQTEMAKESKANLDAVNQQYTQLVGELTAIRDNIGGTNEEQHQRLVGLTIENEKLKEQLQNINATQEEIRQLRLDNREKDDRLFKLEQLRRQMHNTIQELRGKIRVYVRARPLLPFELENNNYNNNNNNNINGLNADGTPGMNNGGVMDHLRINSETDNITLTHSATRHNFTFDKVFSTYDGQEEIFAEVSGFVQSALDGYNVCVFAYGQTGSGKTFTMQGSTEREDMRGIIPRAAELLVETGKRLHLDGWEYSFEASYMEIYNETIRDLLRAGANTAAAGGMTPAANSNSAAAKDNICAIREDKNKMPYVAGLTTVQVREVCDVLNVVRSAERHRSVAVTDMNEHSSRSHSIFLLRIKGQHAARNVQLAGNLYLCDLAGSERLKKSNAVGDRLKETQAINRSLSSLSDIFYNLNQKNAHVPYRNSKLTHILQPCLSGSGKCSMVVALSPDLASCHETLCSLRFASTVSQTELGQVTKMTSTLSSTHL